MEEPSFPQVSNAPSDLNDLLDKVYKSANKQYKDKGKASATAWAAAKNLGWYKSKDGQWKKKGESEESYWEWNNFWKQVEYTTPYGFDRSSIEALGTINVKESLIPFRARILAAVPGKSLNGRVYPRETLMQMTPLYDGKPFIFDHVIENAEKVAGIIARPRYGVEEGWDGQKREGTWLDAIGLIEPNMLERLTGKGPVPPLIRGVSIGGQGDGQYNADGGTVIKNFQPAELSITAFPGIPDAQIASINMITESYRKQGLLRKPSHENKKMSKATERIPIREIGSGPGQTNQPIVPSMPRPAIRGLNAQVDSIPRQNQSFTVPQSTYDDPNRQQVNPYDTPSGSAPFQSRGAGQYAGLKGQSSTEGPATGADYGAKSSRDAKAWSIKTPKLGRTTTQTPGFGGMTPSGTGISDQSEIAHQQRVNATVASLQNDLNNVLYQMRTGKSIPEAKVKAEDEEEEEEEAKVKAEDEEEETEERILLRHLARLEQKKLARELEFDLGPHPDPSNRPDNGMSGYARTMNTGPRIDVTHSPPNEATPQGNADLYKAGSRASAFAPQESYQPTKEEEGKVDVGPGKGRGLMRPPDEEDEEEEEEKRTIWNRVIALRMKKQYGLEAAPGGERPYTKATIPKTPKLGRTTTKSPGFGNLSPSGTGIKDQPEEEEEEERIMYNGKVYRREQEDPKSDVDKDVSPEGEEEEEEAMPSVPVANLKPDDPKNNPLMRVQRDPDADNDQDNVGANPVTAGGEESRYGQSPQDVEPIQGSATSFPLGNVSLWQRYIKRDNNPSEKELKGYVEMWRQRGQPKPVAIPQIRVKAIAESIRPMNGQTPPRGIPASIPSLPGVPARGISGNPNTFSQPYQTQAQVDTRSVTAWGAKKLEEIDKSPFGRYNRGGNLWQEYLKEYLILE